MKIILLFLFFISCNLNESLVDSIGETAKSVIEKAKEQGGSTGVSTLNKEIDKLEDEIADLKKKRSALEDKIDDKEDDLEEIEDELEEIKERLENDRELDPAERERLENERDRLQTRRDDLTREITTLREQITTAENAKTQAENTLRDVRQAKERLEADLRTRTTERDRARTERDTANREKTRVETERDCWKKTKGDFCTRNQKLKTVVIAQVAGISACEDINYCHLEDITRLDLSGSFDRQSACNSNPEYNRLTTLQPSDFIGFTKLEFLNLSGNCLKELEQSPPLFKHLTKIKEINLQDTNIIRLSKNFFTSDNIDTLEDGKVWVNWFLYCTGTGTPYKDKLSSEAKAYHTREDPNNPESYYCYE